jgi:EAL and modified HD-GYP domain-containing signal transduction protein
MLCAEITSLAVACPGHSMPAGFGDWLRKLPGPHLALGTTESVCPGFCKFHWLAGHLAGHVTLTPKGDPTTRTLLLKLLGLVTSDADSNEIEAVIKRDTNLSYHLLKLVNSVAFPHAHRIDNFTQAITLLGRRQLQRWLQLLLYSRSQGSGAASPLLPRAALRANLMEELARRLHCSRDMQDHAFIAGMFSLLDILFGLPLAELIEPLNLPEEIVVALTGAAADGRGQLGDLLAAVIASEGRPAATLADALAVAGIDREEWAAALTTAMRWAVQVSREA